MCTPILARPLRRARAIRPVEPALLVEVLLRSARVALRVGELSRRTGVGVSTLRAWEARFGFLNPRRSPSGHRQYDDADVDRVNAVVRLVGEGLTLPGAIARVSSAGPGALPSGEGEALLYGQVLQAVGQGVWVMLNGRTRYVNRRMAELMRWTIDDMMAAPIDDLFGPLSPAEDKERRRLLRRGTALHFTNHARRADGTWFLAEIDMTPLFDHAGRYEGAVAVVNDITARAEEERQARFRAALLDSVGEAVAAGDRDGRVIYINAAAERLFGVRAADIIGKDGRAILGGSQALASAERIHKRLMKGQRYSGDLTLARADGTEFVAHITGAPAFDANGALLGLIAVITDPTQRQRLEREREVLEAQVEMLTLLGAQALRAHSGREDTLSEALDGTRRLLDAEQVTVLTAEGSGVFRTLAGSPSIDTVMTVPRGGRSFAGYVALARKVIVVNDARTDRRFDAHPIRADLVTAGAIGAPIIIADRVAAVLTAESGAPGHFDVSARHFVQGVANVIGAAFLA